MIRAALFDFGGVILTNADSGVLLRGPFMRKLAELLFDGKSEADAQLATAAAARVAAIKKERERLISVLKHWLPAEKHP